jgi:hypothetical protein
MEPAIPKKLKAQCQTCKKSFGGTFEKLNTTPRCPKCGAEGDWWRPIETRMIQRARLKAQAGAQPYYPPKPVAGRDWVPRPGTKNRELVLGLGIAGIVLSPLGLITGPIGLWKAAQDLKEIKRGEAQSDGMLTGGIIVCVASMLISLFGAWYCYLVIDYFTSQGKINNASAQLDRVSDAVKDYSDRRQELPNSLDEVRKAGHSFPEKDPWGHEWGYYKEGDGARLVCYGSDGTPGGMLAAEDIEVVLRWEYQPLFGGFGGFGSFD